MPSPVGHALGGIAAGWYAAPKRDRVTAAILAATAIAPDLDLFFGTHREASHSIGAAALAASLAALVCRRDRVRWATAAGLVWLSHVGLDWLSNDTRPPIGVMALWPISRDYFKAAIEIFPPVSRRYWESRFWLYNLRALAVEIAVLGPLAALVVWHTRRAR